MGYYFKYDVWNYVRRYFVVVLLIKYDLVWNFFFRGDFFMWDFMLKLVRIFWNGLVVCIK